ncbi:MAG: fucose isomerase [Lawsonibacter sp.]|nr:fucose isomerase [Lawsonibacter sp.]
MTSSNLPTLRLGIIAASRNNFADELSLTSRAAITAAAVARGLSATQCPTLVVTEQNAMDALAEASAAGCEALVVVLGNFGPETPETLSAKKFVGPVMYVATSEENAGTLYAGRRDSYCGMLNCSYNLNLRNCTNYYLPPYPVGTPEEIAGMMERFYRVATAAVALRSLKILIFGPRPSDFFACNAPIKPLYDLGVEVQENSEMDLLVTYKAHAGDVRIPTLAEQMRKEVGDKYPDTLLKMAQYELTLLDWIDAAKGASRYVALANKCWPAFQKEFGFLPCYVHSRLAAVGIPVGCETDVYGALSEYLGRCVSGRPTTILDINNNIPRDVFEAQLQGRYPYTERELFLGFHCGNTAGELLCSANLRYKMNRKDPYAPETGTEETRGTLEGPMKPGEVSCFRLHSTADGRLEAYIAKGEILPAELTTYGCWALFGVPQMDRFYRHVLLEKQFPHHSAIVYGAHSAELYDLMQLLGVPYIGYNHPRYDRYETENPFG